MTQQNTTSNDGSAKILLHQGENGQRPGYWGFRMPCGTSGRTRTSLALLEKYDPTVRKSELISAEKSGIGAKRKVYMKDGKNWFEEKVTIWQPCKELTIQLTNCTFPINSLRHDYSFLWNGDATIVRQVMEYEVKFGLLGRIMDWMMIKKQSDKGIKLFMGGLKKIVEENK